MCYEEFGQSSLVAKLLKRKQEIDQAKKREAVQRVDKRSSEAAQPRKRDAVPA